ncbi:sugar-binding protein [Xylanimonas ulmi]|uniref:Monosaccharide ABC transporter substrate-binding protein (CUT2 family) n=1 Tax=Xylanimonas ulmi TaxID=228973 RepID=A0A4Q7M867_9MICO|nr:sugar-binding protein [Xylanibacterium ulmi]RZS62882.1 monosaccharide ABC transporter substrate-binding protein (CUT2 family) [Xylanibacterium ulmi]
MKKLKSALVASAMVSVLALSGCGEGRGGDATADGDGDGFGADAVIGVALPQQTSENWVLAEDLFNDGLREAGFEPIVQFANAGVIEQQNQIEAMIERGASVIVVGAVDGAQLGTQVEAARAAGATVIAYDRLLTQTPDVDLYVAFDNFQVGVLQGTALLDGLAARKGEGPWNIELIGGSADDANSTPFFEGAMSVLQPKIDDGTLTVVSGQNTFEQVATAGWLADNAQRRMDTVLAGFYADGAELHGILSPNDTLARAALTAVDSAGLDVPVITGQDSEVESVRSIMEGVQFSTIYKDTRALVAETIRQIKLAQQGESFDVNDELDNGVTGVPTFFLPPVIVTQDNAVEVFDGDPILEPVMSEFK